MFKHSWKITVPMTIVVIFGFGISTYVTMQESNFKYRLLIELKDWLRIETEVDKE